MSLSFENLDDATREHMLAELDGDEKTATLYVSERLSPLGADAYPRLLREAIEHGEVNLWKRRSMSPGCSMQPKHIFGRANR